MLKAVSLALLIALQTGAQCVAAGGNVDRESQSALGRDIANMSAQYNHGRYILAEYLGRAILAKYPTDPDTHYLLGNIYCKMKNVKAATQQYEYCIRTDNRAIRTLASAALARLKLTAAGAAPASAAALSNATPPTDKIPSLANLKQAATILERAQTLLEAKKKQVDAEIAHNESFARSRIKDIPYNTVYRRMNLFAGIQAARDNEDYYSAPNYDRPIEVSRIRATESAKVRRYIDDFNMQQKAIVEKTLKEVEPLIGSLNHVVLNASNTGSSNTGAGNVSSRSAIPTKAISLTQAFSACGINTHKEIYGQRVLMVSSASPGSRGGLVPGDLIEHSNIDPLDGSLKLTLRRGDKIYSLSLHPDGRFSASGASVTTGPASVSGPPPSASGPLPSAPGPPPSASGPPPSASGPPPSTSGPPAAAVSQAAWARIRDSDIVFVQDMSNNMRLPLGDTGLTKAEWCGQRIVDCAETIARNSAMGFTLIQCYQNSYEMARDQNATGLRQHFGAARGEPSNLSTPLQFITSDYFDSASRKPLLILVLTDGHPERGESLEATIKNIVDKANNQDQVRVIFFQIGEDPVGTAALQMLDDDLTYAGHKYDIVDWVKFDDLQDSGMSRALLEAYQRPRSVGSTALPALASELSNRLAEVRAQMAKKK